MVTIECPSCHSSYRVADEKIGKRVRCRQCQETFTVAQARAETVEDKKQHSDDAGKMATASADTDGARKTNRDLPDKIGRFEIQDELGAGMFGTVYRAWDPVLDREVALKVPQASAVGSEEARARFLREAKAAAQLRHPDIVPVHDAGCDGDELYIAATFVAGHTLEDAITSEEIDMRRGAEICMKLAEALDYAHEQGIVHRDIKPANVMLDEKGEPHLMDFGLAAWEESKEKLTIEGSVMGTPAYMSPEQAGEEGLEVGSASDQYSLGVVLYELLTGKRPFSGPIANVIYQIRKEDPQPPRNVDSQIPRDLETICLKAMSKEPHKRYADDHALAEDLRRWLNNEPIQARRTTAPERFLRWCKRKPVLAGMTGAVAVLLLVVAVGSTLAAIRLDAERKRADWKAAEALEQKQRADGKAAEADGQRERAEKNLAQVERERDRADQNSRRAYQQYYVAQMNLAQRAWEEVKIGSLLERLKQTEPQQAGGEDLRGFEWYYWQHLCPRELSSQKHRGPVNSVTFSPDGKRLASAGSDGVKLWDATLSQESVTLSGYVERVNSVAFSPDGKELAVAEDDGSTVEVWDVESGKKSLMRIGLARGNCVAFSPDSKRVASSRNLTSPDGRIWVGDVATGEELLTWKGHKCAVTSLVFSPNGKRLASASVDSMIKVWDAATGDELLTIKGEFQSAIELKRREESVGEESLDIKGHALPVNSMAFSPDGKRLASASDDTTIKVWDATTGDEFLTIRGHAQAVNSVAFSPDGKRLASASDDGMVKVWDATTGQELLALVGHWGEVNSVAFSPDGKRLASGGHGVVKVWQATLGQESIILKGHAQGVNCVVISPDGKRLASAGRDGTVKLWDAATGEEMLALEVDVLGVKSVAFSPDGKWLTSGEPGGGTVKLSDAATGDLRRTLGGHGGDVNSVAFSPDGKRLAWATGGFGFNSIRVQNTQRGFEPLTRDLALKHGRAVNCAAFSPEGKRLASATGMGVSVYDASTGQGLLSLGGHRGEVNCVAFSPNGKWLASAGADSTIKLWDAATGEELLTLKGHFGHINSVAFSPDGKRLASASDDGTVKLWHLEIGQEMLTLRGHARAVKSVVFSPDGHKIVSGGWDGTIRVWDATPQPETYEN